MPELHIGCGQLPTEAELSTMSPSNLPPRRSYWETVIEGSDGSDIAMVTDSNSSPTEYETASTNSNLELLIDAANSSAYMPVNDSDTLPSNSAVSTSGTHSPPENIRAHIASSSNVASGSMGSVAFMHSDSSAGIAAIDEPSTRIGASSTEENKNRLICPRCGFPFKRKWNLQKHTEAVHEKKRPFPCSKCPLIFGHKGSRDKHHRTVHLKVLRFACPHPGCGHKFFRKRGTCAGTSLLFIAIES
eukprot:IDg12445t1